MGDRGFSEPSAVEILRHRDRGFKSRENPDEIFLILRDSEPRVEAIIPDFVVPETLFVETAGTERRFVLCRFVTKKHRPDAILVKPDFFEIRDFRSFFFPVEVRIGTEREIGSGAFERLREGRHIVGVEHIVRIHKRQVLHAFHLTHDIEPPVSGSGDAGVREMHDGEPGVSRQEPIKNQTAPVG